MIGHKSFLLSIENLKTLKLCISKLFKPVSIEGNTIEGFSTKVDGIVPVTEDLLLIAELYKSIVQLFAALSLCDESGERICAENKKLPPAVIAFLWCMPEGKSLLTQESLGLIHTLRLCTYLIGESFGISKLRQCIR